jgi:hypothetical protein
MRSEQAVRDTFQQLRFVPNVGMVLGEQQSGDYVLAIDFDDDDRALKLLDEYGELPATATSRSKRGNRMLFIVPPDVPRDRLKNVTGLGGEPGVDVKVKGGQIVIPPSLHPSGVSYSWVQTGALAELPPGWALAILSRPEPPKWIAEYTPQRFRDDRKAQKRAEKYLEAAVIDEARLLSLVTEGARNTSFHMSLCRLLPVAQWTRLATGHGYVVRELSSAARATGLKENEIHSTVASAERWLKESGAVRMPMEVMAGAAPMSTPAPEQAPDPGEKEIKLIMDGGTPAKCAENVARLLLEHADWQGGPRLDTFTDTIVWPSTTPKPLASLQRSSPSLIDDDETALQGWLLARPYIQRVKVGVDTVGMGIRLAARRKTFDSLKERVESLPKWDGSPRLSKWLVKLAGARDTEVNKLFGRRWLISCIARALNPGCVADGALVLEGDQGIGKNRLVTAIFGEAPWVQSIGAYKVGQDIEADRIAGSSWIVHDDEMSVRRSEIDALKAWISRREDTYRPPYGRNLVTRPRRAVLICSTNRKQYLEDERNRRFWPVPCGVIDVALAVQWGAQLLAEAMVAYRAGEGWTISTSDPMWSKVDEEQADRRVRDPVEDNIRSALKSLGNPETITISKLADQVGLRPERLDRSIEMRYGAILRDIGYFRDRVTTEEGRTYLFRKTTLSKPV